MNGGDFFRDKGFWWTAGLTAVAVEPSLLIPAAICGAGYVTVKGVAKGAKGIASALRGARDRARQRAEEREAEAAWQRWQAEEPLREARRKEDETRRPIEAAAQARRDYELECQIMTTLGLEADEREAALLHARRRLMGRLRELLP